MDKKLDYNLLPDEFDDDDYDELNYDFVSVKIDCSNIIESSYNEIKDLEIERFYNIFHVSFENEGGTQYGGYLREWLTNLIKELLNPKFKLFESTDTNCIYLNPNSFKQE